MTRLLTPGTFTQTILREVDVISNGRVAFSCGFAAIHRRFAFSYSIHRSRFEIHVVCIIYNPIVSLII